MELYDIQSSMTGFFYLAYFQSPSMLSYASEFHSYFWGTQLYRYLYTYFAYPFTGWRHWTVSTFWLLWITLHKVLYEHVFSYIFYGVQLLGSIILSAFPCWTPSDFITNEQRGRYWLMLCPCTQERVHFVTNITT